MLNRTTVSPAEEDSSQQAGATHFRRNMRSHRLPSTLVVIALLMSLVLEGETKEIKVKAVTLTGKSLSVLVEHDASVRDLKVGNAFSVADL